MTITEKTAYLKGLANGLEINNSTKEGKLLLAIVETLELIGDEIADLQDVCEELDEVVNVLDEDLEALEQEFLDEDEIDEEKLLEDLYEITCSSCGDQLYVDGEMLEEGSMDCPACGHLLEFDVENKSSKGNDQTVE